MEIPTQTSEPSNNNLLLDLHAYAHQQDENFTTKAFAHLLRHLLMNESKAAANFLKKLTGGWLRLDEDACRVVRVSTQVRTPDGQPDIEITSSREMVIVEVKVDAPVRPGQIRNYRKILKDSVYDRDRTRLVLLTRFDSRLRPRDKPDFAVYWYKVADWLSEADKGLKEKTSKYLCQQFLGFMRGRGLTMDHVGKEFVPGIQAISNFRAMLEHALGELDLRKLRRSAWVGAVGCHFHIGRRFFWVGIGFSEPSELWLTEFKHGSRKWIEVRDGGPLDLDKVGFFDLPKEDQTECLKSFIRKETAGGKRPRS
ncbi:MAG: hypothetical protein ABSG32_12585 [Terriglobia bacterium]